MSRAFCRVSPLAMPSLLLLPPGPLNDLRVPRRSGNLQKRLLNWSSIERFSLRMCWYPTSQEVLPTHIALAPLLAGPHKLPLAVNLHLVVRLERVGEVPELVPRSMDWLADRAGPNPHL